MIQNPLRPHSGSVPLFEGPLRGGPLRGGSLLCAALYCCLLAPVLSAHAQIVPDPVPETSVERTGQRPPRDDSSPLPWNDNPVDRPRLPVRQLGGPRELLQLFGIDESQIQSLFDGQPLGPDQDEALARLLFRMPQIGLENLHRWTRPAPPGEELAGEPDAHRVQFFRLEGRVLRVDQHELIPELAELFDFKSYYRVQMQRPDDPHPILVCARRVPAAWPIGESLDERARIDALFLKVGEARSDAPELVFVADRVAWLPDRTNPRFAITEHQVLLAELGMDISLLDDVRERNRRPIGGPDRECFYQMLVAADGLTPEQLDKLPGDTLDLAPLLLQPETQHGRLIRCRGTARRVTRIEVNDPDIRERFGIDHYYQLDVFLPLGERTIRLGKTEDDGPVFTNNFPATFCVLRLPDELRQLADRMAAGNLETETLNEQIALPAFYFKLWVYKSQYVSSFDKQQRQIAPMLVGAMPRVIHRQARHDVWLSLIVGGTFVALLGAAWIGVWRYSRSDARFERTTINRQFRARPDKSLNDMGIESRTEPDFSNLADAAPGPAETRPAESGPAETDPAKSDAAGIGPGCSQDDRPPRDLS